VVDWLITLMTNHENIITAAAAAVIQHQ